MTAQRVVAASLVFIASAGPVRAQLPDSSERHGPPIRLPVRLSGDVTAFNELYGASGIQARRPGETWRVMASQQLTFLGSFSVGLNVLWSSEGSELRQNISQLGLNPRWRWATLHIGDFSQNFSGYTVQGTRLRGGGVDLRPGILRLSLQGGEAQRTVAAGGAGNLVYRRTLYAGLIGVGREQSNYLDLLVVRARDDSSSLGQALSDTLLLDTIPAAVRPRYDTRPQANLVVGTRGQLILLHHSLQVSGEGAVGIITRDVDAPAADPTKVPGGGTLGGAIPVTLSTSRDYAGRIDGSWNAAWGGLRGSYEYIGAGFTSLGLAYVISDRRSWMMGGSARLAGGRVNVQGQYQHQNDNLVRQRAFTTDRNTMTGSASVLFSRNVTATLTAMNGVIGNHADVDTFLVDNHSLAVTANTALQTTIAHLRSAISVAYAYQATADGNPVTRIPHVTVHNLSTSVQLTVSRALSLAPSLSYATTQTEGAASQRNAFLGLRAQGRFGTLRPSAALARSYSSGRVVTTMTGQLGYALPWQARLSIQARHARYGAIGSRPAFNESFFTTTVSRSF